VIAAPSLYPRPKRRTASPCNCSSGRSRKVAPTGLRLEPASPCRTDRSDSRTLRRYLQVAEYRIARYRSVLSDRTWTRLRRMRGDRCLDIRRFTIRMPRFCIGDCDFAGRGRNGNGRPFFGQAALLPREVAGRGAGERRIGTRFPGYGLRGHKGRITLATIRFTMRWKHVAERNLYGRSDECSSGGRAGRRRSD